MALTEKEAVIVGCIVGSFIVIIFGLLLWYFCADTHTPSQPTQPDYSKLHIDTPAKKPDRTAAADEDVPLTIVPCICGANLTLIEAQHCYDDRNAIDCYLCDTEVSGASKVYHCRKWDRKEHRVSLPKGYDVCVTCACNQPISLSLLDSTILQYRMPGDDCSDEEKKTIIDETDSNTFHYLIISIVVGDWSARDFDFELLFDGKSMRKGRRGFVKRFKFEQKDQMPQNISYELVDPDERSREIFVLYLKAESLANNYCFRRQDNYRTIGIIYHQTTCRWQLKMKKCNERFKKKLRHMDPYADILLPWFESNKAVIFSLKKHRDERRNLTNENFTDMIAPPHRLTEKDCRFFLISYEALHKLFDEDGFKAYYDEELKVLYYDDDTPELSMAHDVTIYVLMLWRYVFLHNILLKGQDNEFNIYRSFYFAPDEFKIPMALLALLVQIVLSVGITIHIADNFEYIYERDLDVFVTICSLFVFGLISMSAYSTATAFVKFYENIYYAYDVPWFFVVCDFISNMVMSSYICAISLFLLMQSE
eukprot:813732_1